MILGVFIIAYILGYITPSGLFTQQFASDIYEQDSTQEEEPLEQVIEKPISTWIAPVPAPQQTQPTQTQPPETPMQTQPQKTTKQTTHSQQGQQAQTPQQSQQQTTQTQENQTHQNQSNQTETRPPQNPCENISCNDSIITCPDGTHISCQNSCSQATGQCSACTPDCTGHENMQPTLNHIIFTQVYYEPAINYSTEWIEIYNPSENTVSLSGWTLNDNSDRNTWTFPDGTEIYGKSYAVIVRNAEDFDALFACTQYIDTTKNSSILNNDGDQLTLRDNGNNEIDFVSWEGGFNSTYPDWTISAAKGMSILRSSVSSDTGTPQDWLSSQGPDPHCT